MKASLVRLICVLALLGACGDGSDDGDGGTGGTGGGGAGPGEVRQLRPFEGTVISSRDDEPNYRRAQASIDLGEGPFASATLYVSLESPCFPFSKWREPGAIPPGHGYPAACDAYDRTFSFQLLPKEEGTPGIELVRAITPFGGPMRFDVDLTDIANGLPGPHELEVTIDTWPDGEGRVSGSRGSWIVSAVLELTPGEPSRDVLAVVPLFNRSWQGPAEEGAFGPFTIPVPEGTKWGRLEYRTTGHGGGELDSACIGHADEFCRRTHSLSLGGDVVDTFEPWRTCERGCTVVSTDPDAPMPSYCLENPTANQQSAVAPRANWCPGEVTGPYVYEHPSLSEPGELEATWVIDRIAEGGSWRVSGIFFAYGEG